MAHNLRTLRAERGLSLSDVARATGISSSFLSLVEQGRSDITIGRLIRLAELYDIELPDLVGGNVSPPTDLILLRADPQHMIHSDAEGVDVYSLTRGSHWTLIPTLGIHQPGGGVEVDGINEREAMVFVLQGTFELKFDDRSAVRLRRGEGAIYRSISRYRFANIGKGEGRVLAIGLHMALST
jgi:transcriptional regulator with XRE-family HTH domain